MLVQDRKTGRWYDPKEKMKELMEAPWFIEQMKRMKDASFRKGYEKGLADCEQTVPHNPEGV
jgi:hypothetical protein